MRTKGVARSRAGVVVMNAIGGISFEARKSWQDYVASHSSVMKCMEGDKLEQATSWEELCATHARFVGDYNFQSHFAH